MSSKILILSSIIIGLATFQLWEVVETYFCVNLFREGMSVATFLMAVTIFKTCKVGEKKVACFLMLITGNDMFDELLFNPLSFSIHEKISALVFIVICYNLKVHAWDHIGKK